MKLIKQLIQIDQHWVPKGPAHSLYIRPTLSMLLDLDVISWTQSPSRHTDSTRRDPTEQGSSFRHLQSCWTLLPYRFQASRALRYYGVHSRSSWWSVHLPCLTSTHLNSFFLQALARINSARIMHLVSCHKK